MKLPAIALVLALACACGSNPARDADSFDRPDSERAASAKTLHSLARLLAAQGRDGECERALERLLADYPDFAPAYNDLAALHLRHGRWAEAEASLAAGLERVPQDPVLLNNLGLCHLRRGDREGALTSFTAASAASPRDARVRANLALTLALLGRKEEAEALYLQVLPADETQHNLAVLEPLRSSAGGSAASPTEEWP